MAIKEQASVRSNWLKRHWLLSLLLAIMLTAGLWRLWHGDQGKKQELPVVKADNKVLAEGVVYPVHYAELAMPVEGTVGDVLVREGDRVKEGQPIIRLVREEYQDRVGSARSNVAGAAAAVEQARVSLTEAERELARQQRLDKARATTRQELERAQTAVQEKEAALAQAQADLTAGKEKLAESQGQMNKTELRAPIDGTVVFMDVKVGEHAAAGTVLVRIADESSWEVRSDDLTELSVAKVKVGDAVELTFDGIPGLDLPGRVKFIRAYGEKKRGDITYTVFIAPERWDERLHWNMTAQIAITPST
ncbi:rnd efflux pump membrane fusion protein barrel-sandwich domain [Lucifera butyrica]|uniref:Rnd efflux pump membrane fusion protein barrel-sandwich domain n=1 Tax=Lucifera butyrica TaxID=1351585 RepID=A0A498R1A0_9FIRM|nr:efflux RND transporter periplasmic adaptor subunit [Lucifera butyrica]VBB05111.1 rnd efflux pump membrane fusion protein barrel-sandwich domain [Lucifera butyrica]